MDLTTLPHGLTARGVRVRAIVATPRGSRCKFTIAPALEALELSKRLPNGLCFPLDFGFIPGTRAENGDPLDALILADDPLPVGCVLDVRLIGLLEAEQTADGETYRNDRLLSVAEESLDHAKVRRLADLGAAWLDELAALWVNYNTGRGRRFEPLARRDATAAAALVGRHSLA
jgi:inorganic pyrophosphatase